MRLDQNKDFPLFYAGWYGKCGECEPFELINMGGACIPNSHQTITYSSTEKVIDNFGTIIFTQNADIGVVVSDYTEANPMPAPLRLFIDNN